MLDEKITVLEGFNEIEGNLSLLQGDLTIHCNNIDFSIAQHSSRISFKAENRSVAEALRNEVLQFSTPLRFLYRHFFLFLAMPFIIGVSASFIESEPISTYMIMAPVAFSILVACAFAYYSIIVKRVYFKPRGSFIKRNSDSIILSIVTGVIGLVIGKIWE